ncbi:CoxG family protein [Gracilibacillus thailandensis]|uniref:SRPBCC family protein n=1 Tax=Gracilibacillus thailandensis TaxID=563735 RepID=A0A6N7R5C5_9BACI|nr:SRPBCC family protein [Gracilibacillus thailandensis]MRI68463.1 SRPBCC family protein [Gracilibacillus thailandensis]
MPNGTHFVQLDLPIEKVWEFVSDINRWAPLAPGYIDHKIIDDHQSTWHFKGDVGKVQKKIGLKVNIIEWVAPTSVRFKLEGISENLEGSGYFQAEKITTERTNVTGCLSISAGGMMAPMINSVLKSVVPKTTIEFTESVANRLMKEKAVSK